MKAHSSTHQHDKKSIYQFLPGPVKIKDGLFLGDQIAARDIEFIVSNKVTHIINTVSGQIPNLWERFGIHYLSVNWTQKEQNIFDKKNNSVNKIFHFIEEAMQLGESCLIHSVNAKSRSCAVLVAYLIKKYAWSLDKCLEFISAKKQNLQIRNNYLIQIQQLEQRMSQIYNLATQWGYSNNQEELILRNTYMNSKPLQITQIEKSESKKISKRVKWGEKTIITKPAQEKTTTNTKQRYKLASDINLKSILKGNNIQEFKNVPNLQQDNFQFQQLQSQKTQGQSNLINNINGKIVHVTVNNFISTQKKTETQHKNAVSTRPFSSDQKDREKQKIALNNAKKNIINDTNPLISFKSPYDNKISGVRPGLNQKMQKNKEQRGTNNLINTHERPQSAKSRSGRTGNNQLKLKDQLIITNGLSSIYALSKKRYTVNSQEDFLKKK